MIPLLLPCRAFTGISRNPLAGQSNDVVTALDLYGLFQSNNLTDASQSDSIVIDAIVSFMNCCCLCGCIGNNDCNDDDNVKVD